MARMAQSVRDGFGINGERDIVDYNTHIAPKVFIPIHTTAVAVEGSSLEWLYGYRAQQNAMGIPAAERPEVMWLVDPQTTSGRSSSIRPTVVGKRTDTRVPWVSCLGAKVTSRFNGAPVWCTVGVGRSGSRCRSISQHKVADRRLRCQS